jgi:hypothetical protein
MGVEGEARGVGAREGVGAGQKLGRRAAGDATPTGAAREDERCSVCALTGAHRQEAGEKKIWCSLLGVITLRGSESGCRRKRDADEFRKRKRPHLVCKHFRSEPAGQSR